MDVQPGWLASGAYSFDVTTSVVNSNWTTMSRCRVVRGGVQNPGSGSWDFLRTRYGSFALPNIGQPEISLVPAASWTGVEPKAAPASIGLSAVATEQGQSVSHCPACGGTDTAQIGEPASGFDTAFAGAHFFQPPYAVHVCSNCGLHFKTVTLTPASLAAYYVALDGGVFDVEADFPTDRVLQQHLSALPDGSRVLDFGCQHRPDPEEVISGTSAWGSSTNERRPR